MEQLFKKVKAKYWLFTGVLLLSLFTTNSLTAQEGTTISGLVSEAGTPLPGVNIIEKGTTNGTQTDFDGKFNLTLTTENATLIASYIGFATKEIAVNGGMQFNIVLEEDTQSLEEVVVVGYGSVKKSDLTGAIVSLDSEALTERNFTNPLESIQGNVAGVQISNTTGRVGDGFNIQIRGQSSFSGGSPLFVVDGAPVDDIDFLNPQDIQQIDILKDASSSAIYGSRGSNGVVIITTKSGSSAKGGFNVSFDTFIGIKEVTRLPELMDGETWQYYHQSAYLATIGGDPMDIDADRLESTVVGGSNSVLRNRFDANQTFDWYDAVLRSGIQQNNYLNINGRSENGVAYNLGLGYQHETGNVLNEDLDKFTLKTGLSHNVNDKFSFGANVTITKTENERGSSSAMQQAFRLNPFLSPYAIDDNGNETTELFDQPGKLVFPTDGNFAINKTSTYNPLLQIANSSDNIKRWNIVGNVFMNYNFLEWLSFKTTLSTGYDTRERGRSWGVLTNEGRSNGSQPLGDISTRNSFNYTWDNQININKSFNEKHNFKFLALQSIFSSQIESSFVSARNLSFESGINNLGSGPQSTFNLGTGYLAEKLSSYALRLNYDYEGKYFATISNRWDGYSLFSEGNKWDSFASAALAWTISKEDFIGDDSILSNLKLRASYGTTGNNSFNRNVNPYPTLNTLNQQLFYDIDGPVNGFRASSLANSELTWEKTNEWNAGLDFGFANNRISGSVDVYNRLSEGILFERLLPVEVGAESGILDNASSVRNKGIEALLNAKIINTEKISWDVTLTYTNNTNSVESINGQSEVDDIGNGLFIGESIGVAGENGNRSNYNYVFDGIWQAGEDAAAFGQTEGQAKVKDINGDGQITPEDDRVILGSVDPDWTGSLFTNLRIGNFTISASAITNQGVFTYSPWLQNFTDTRDRGRQKADISWYVPENGAGIPAQFSNEYPQARNQGDFWRRQRVGYYADASFVKIKNISLSYNFDNKILDKLKIKGLRVYANVLDPFVFTDYLGYDPETAGASLGVGRTAAITYQVGLNIKL